MLRTALFNRLATVFVFVLLFGLFAMMIAGNALGYQDNIRISTLLGVGLGFCLNQLGNLQGRREVEKEFERLVEQAVKAEREMNNV
jgi:hypothetical protein